MNHRSEDHKNKRINWFIKMNSSYRYVPFSYTRHIFVRHIFSPLSFHQIEYKVQNVLDKILVSIMSSWSKWALKAVPEGVRVWSSCEVLIYRRGFDKVSVTTNPRWYRDHRTVLPPYSLCSQTSLDCICTNATRYAALCAHIHTYNISSQQHVIKSDASLSFNRRKRFERRSRDTFLFTYFFSLHRTLHHSLSLLSYSLAKASRSLSFPRSPTTLHFNATVYIVRFPSFSLSLSLLSPITRFRFSSSRSFTAI